MGNYLLCDVIGYYTGLNEIISANTSFRGLTFEFLIGYSYDIANSDINQFTSGSHEFMFGVTFRPSTQNQIMR